MKKGITTQMCVIEAIQFMSNGSSFDQVDELCELSESAARKSFYAFADEVVAMFGEECLQASTDPSHRQTLVSSAGPGFPTTFAAGTANIGREKLSICTG